MKRPFLPLAALLLAGFAVCTDATRAGPAVKATDDGPDGAKLWAQNCTRCHNNRPQKTFSDAQWDVVVHHMRVRGYLTGAEARAIAAFIKEGN